MIAAGLIDELRIHLTHVLLGSGTRLFEGLDIHGVQFVNTRVVPGPGVTHLTFDVRMKRPG